MKRSKLWLLLAVLAGVALIAAGCGGGGGDDEGTPGDAAEGGTMAIAWGAEPPSLDPGLATDTTSANVLLNIMDPLVKLEGEDLRPVPALAESWETSNGGKVYTFKLRADGKWTNGDPVVAEDFVYSWKRTLDPELAADYAYQLYGIKGAQEYNECEKNCDRMRDGVAVEAVDDRTLRVELTSAQPWFPQLAAHHSFLAVHRPTVEQFGDNWTEARNIVTNGPFKLATWEHEARIDLTKWAEWRGADQVSLQRVNGRIITEGTTAIQAFEAGEVDVVETGIPPQETPRLKGTPEYQQYPALGTFYYGFNLKNVPDVRQRRAMSLAIDRRTIIDNISQQGEIPATGFTPDGIAGFETINPDSPWSPASADVDQAKQLMSQVADPQENVTIYYNNAPGNKEVAIAIQDMWKQIGIDSEIKQQEWAQFLEFLGPPPDQSVDVFRLGWIYDYPDAMNGLELWTCDSGNNSTNWCNKKFDSLVERARSTPNNEARYKLYQQMEDVMFGQNGDVPLIPIYWYTTVMLENEKVRDTFEVNPQTFFDLAKVEVKA